MRLRVQAIALNTYRESVRARILLGLAGVAFSVSLFSLVIASFTLNSAARVISDIGAASISLFGIVVAVVVGATTLYRELEQKTIFPILARPLSRGEYLTGKYLGILLTIAVFIAADTGIVLSLCAILGGKDPTLVMGGIALITAALVVSGFKYSKAMTYGPIPWALAMLLAGSWFCGVAPEERQVVLTQGLLSMLEVSVVTALAMLMSSFSTPFVSSLMTVGVWIIGRSSDALDRFPKKFFGPEFSEAARVFGKMVPNLHAYVPPRSFLSGETADVNMTTYLLHAAGNAVAWSIGLLALAALIFRRRDFL